MSIVIDKASHCWGSNVSADGSDEFLLTKGLLVVLLKHEQQSSCPSKTTYHHLLCKLKNCLQRIILPNELLVKTTLAELQASCLLLIHLSILLTTDLPLMDKQGK